MAFKAVKKVLLYAVIALEVFFLGFIFVLYSPFYAADEPFLHTIKAPLVDGHVRLLVVGDTGTGNQDQLNVARAMEKRCRDERFDGVLLLGDNFYNDGVDNIKDKQWQTKFEIPYGSTCLQSLPFYPVLGNHDYKKNAVAQVEYNDVNSRWKMINEFYHIKFGSVLKIVGFDSNKPTFCFDADRCTVDNLKHAITTKNTTWLVAMAHHPIRTASLRGSTHSGGAFGFFMNSIVCDGLDFWVSGHAHHMEYRGMDFCDAKFVVSGGGGAKLYPVNINDGADFVASRHGFAEMYFSADKAVTTFYSTEGEELFTRLVPGNQKL